MDRRYYKRLDVDLLSSFIISDDANGAQEFSGNIKDISEGGIKVSVNYDDFANIADRIKSGDIINFQSIDEYELLKESHVDVFNGEVEVLRVVPSENGLELGCRFVHQTQAIADYIDNKKLSLYFEYFSKN